MPSAHASFLGAVLLSALALPAAADPPEKARPAVPRAGIEALEAHLSRAVDRVSLPYAARLLGRVESARGYRLPGYGVVFVLTPRTLPGGEGRVYVLSGGGPKHRRIRVETQGAPETASGSEDVETFERQVLVLQQEAETARRAAEEEMERIVHDVRVRVAPPAAVQVEVREVQEPPVLPAAPAVPMTPAAPVPPEAPLPPPPPPWKFWFEAGTPHEQRTPEAVMADVRSALMDALGAQGSPVAGLAGDERVTVAVDFVPGGLFAAQARPERTLVLSARVRDVNARARGAITQEELRKRVEVSEY